MRRYKETRRYKKVKSPIAKKLIEMFKRGDELTINKIAIKFNVNKTYNQTVLHGMLGYFIFV